MTTNLNAHLPAQLTLRPGNTYEYPVHSLPSSGFLLFAEGQGDAITVELVSPPPPERKPSFDQLVVGGSCTQILRVTAVKHGLARIVLKHARPWVGENASASEQIIEVGVVDLATQEAWENAIPVVEVSADEVRRALDCLDRHKPYGGQKTAAMRRGLEIIAKDIAVHRHAGNPYLMKDWKVAGFLDLLPKGSLYATMDNARRALVEFVNNRPSA